MGQAPGEPTWDALNRISQAQAQQAARTGDLRRYMRQSEQMLPSLLPYLGGFFGVSEPSLRPAVRWMGKIYTADPGALDHFSAIQKVPAAGRQQAAFDLGNRGFVDPRGRFLNRWRAQDYALKNDLLAPDAPSYARTSPELIGDFLRKPSK